METPMDIMESGVTTLPIKEREPLMHSGSCICVKNKRIAIKDETTPADKSVERHIKYTKKIKLNARRHNVKFRSIQII